LPLKAEVGRVVARNLDDHAFDEDLRSPAVELLDHGSHLTVEGFGRGDDQRVGRGVGLYEAACAGLRRKRQGRACAALPAGAARRAGPADRRRRGAWCRGAAAGASAKARAQDAGHARGVRVLKLDHPDVTCAVVLFQWLIELGNQRAHGREPGRVGDSYDECIGARVDLHRALRCRTRRAAGYQCVEQPLQDRQHIGGDGVAQSYELDLAARWQVDCRNDAADAAEVVCIVRDDEGVVACVGIDRVVRADQRAQDRHQVVRRLMLQPEDLCQHVITGSRRRTHRDGAGLQFGVGFGHDLEQALDLDHREPQAAQGGQVVDVDLARRPDAVVRQRDRPLDPWIDHELPAKQDRHCPCHGVDVRVDEVNRHRPRRWGRVRRATNGACHSQ